jgi:transposase
VALETVLDRGVVCRQGRGRLRLRPRRLAGDKGYRNSTARRRIRRQDITPIMPTKSNEPHDPSFDRQANRWRNQLEQLINRLKQFRRIATRYEKRAVNYFAMLTIGMALPRWSAFQTDPGREGAARHATKRSFESRSLMDPV